MATVTQQVFNTGDDEAANASFVFNDVTGAISAVQYVVNAGTLTMTIKRPGQADIVRSTKVSGSTPIPAGYNMTQMVSHGLTQWVFTDDSVAYEFVWHG